VKTAIFCNCGSNNWETDTLNALYLPNAKAYEYLTW